MARTAKMAVGVTNKTTGNRQIASTAANSIGSKLSSSSQLAAKSGKTPRSALNPRSTMKGLYGKGKR